jgi:hypothetical protein
MTGVEGAINLTRWSGSGSHWRRCLVVMVWAFVPLAAWAGTISFSLSLTGSTLTAMSEGNSSAFLPTVLRLLPDGHWEVLPVLPGTISPAELAPGARFHVSWTQIPRSSQSTSPFEALQPLMVRFFDQAGVSFGQISFLHPPPKATATLQAGYEDGKLVIAPPGDAAAERVIRASWLLWAQEEGIGGIRDPLRLEGRQPSAQHIEWHKGMVPVRIDTGAGQPSAILLHDTGQGYGMQVISAGRLASREQRTAWLDASPDFYRPALLMFAAGVSVVLFGIVGPKGERQDTWIRVLTSSLGRTPIWIGDLVFTVAAASLVASTLGIGFLNSPNTPTGGDTASHVLYARLYADELLFSGHILPWVPEVFGGLPFLSYYFPLPFIVIALLSKLIGFAPAFKWGAFLAAMLLPGAVFVGSRRWLHLSWPAVLFGGLGALAFVLHEQNAIWGGNLLSTLAGEFAYSYSLLFAVLTMMAWARATALGRGWLFPALLEAGCGFSHGFPLLVVGFSTAFLLLDGDSFRRTFGLLLRGHLFAFFLLGGWLWPMIEMHGLTIANDAAFPLADWRDLLPATLWPVFAGGGVGLVLLVVPAVRRTWGADQARVARYFVSAAGLSAVAFIAGDQLGLADIRFFPPVWLLSAIVSGWLLGQVLPALVPLKGARERVGSLTAAPVLFAAAAVAGLLGWIGQHVHSVPDWSLWNHSGLEAKPQWVNLSRLFPAMRGDLWSPRLVFEHDPANSDIGSTRALEALPMFINHRPVLEGLYMESAILGPATYQLQSEVSARPSSPLVRFPSGQLDPDFAARHMNFLHADTLLLRSSKAKGAVEASGLFEKVVESAPFSLYRLKRFSSHLIQVVAQPIRVWPMHDWMQDAFEWFRTRSQFDAFLPVFGAAVAATDKRSADAPARVKQLSRHRMMFETEAVGQPHLIKIAYHPRWHLVSKGTLQIAGPGFMLVVPQEGEIQLDYGLTSVGTVGMFATLGCLLYLVLFSWRMEPRPASVTISVIPSPARLWRWSALAANWVALGLLGAYLWLSSPERHYNAAWDAMRTHQYDEASAQFAHAYKLRRPPAKKEEALFWLAKATELAGHRAEAKNHYHELIERYRGYWLPESLYIANQLERLDGRIAEAEALARRLRGEYSGNKWTQKLDERD